MENKKALKLNVLCFDSVNNVETSVVLPLAPNVVESELNQMEVKDIDFIQDDETPFFPFRNSVLFCVEKTDYYFTHKASIDVINERIKVLNELYENGRLFDFACLARALDFCSYDEITGTMRNDEYNIRDDIKDAKDYTKYYFNECCGLDSERFFEFLTEDEIKQISKRVTYDNMLSFNGALCYKDESGANETVWVEVF